MITKWLLVVLATNTNLGEYTNRVACEMAIKEIVRAQVIPVNVQRLRPDLMDSEQVKQMVDQRYLMQREYLCVKNNS